MINITVANYNLMKYCLDCGTELIGRLDKMYCDDYCRSHYHNKINQTRQSSVKEINRVLKKNAEILEKLNGYGVHSISYEALKSAGFEFNYFTHQVVSPEGQKFNCCYKIGYHILNQNEILIKSPASMISAFKTE